MPSFSVFFEKRDTPDTPGYGEGPGLSLAPSPKSNTAAHRA